MTYPPPPGYPPMPSHPGQLDAEAKPTGGTAIAAAVLAVLGALAGLVLLFFGIAGLVALAQPDTPANATPPVIIGFVLALFMVVLLGVGSILLFLRKRAGQLMVAAGSALTLLGIVVLAIIELGITSRYSTADAAAAVLGVGIVYLIMFGLPALATLILVLVPPTTHYVRWQPGQGAASGRGWAGGFPAPGYPATSGTLGPTGYPAPGQQHWAAPTQHQPGPPAQPPPGQWTAPPG
ncbi:MAG: hypothetical protein ACRDRL_29635 [Sciscionella sp.]